MTFSAEQKELIRIIEKESTALKQRVFIVGGVVRDLLSGELSQNQDLDFVVEGNAIDFANKVALSTKGEVKEFKDFITAKIVKPTAFSSILEIDFATARKEVYESPGALPKVSAATINEDLKRRDFSVNAMALSVSDLKRALATSSMELESSAIDLYGGLDDLNRKLIRVLHSSSFIDDPTRIFRACRYAVRIQGQIDKTSKALVSKAVAAKALDSISYFRKLSELKKIFLEDMSSAILILLHEMAVLQEIVLFNDDKIAEILEGMKRLDLVFYGTKSELKVNLGLTLLFYYLEEDKRAEPFKEYHFGKKTLAQFERNLKDSFLTKVDKTLSDEALLLAFLWDENAALWDEVKVEALRRGLMKNVV